MNRRTFMKAASGALVGAMLRGATSADGAKVSPSVKPTQLALGPGPHLFLDDALIAEQSGITREISHPKKLATPIVTGREDKCFQPYVSVIRDPDTKRFRIWYGVPAEGSASATHLGYMESDDGIHWIRPHKELEDPAPIQFGASVLDEGPGYADKSKRYKFAWWHSGGLQIAASPDGLKWTPIAPGVILPHNHDINNIHWDPIRKRYIAMMSVYVDRPEYTGTRRVTIESVSQDLLHWREPWWVFIPDKQDEGDTQFYCMSGIIARGDLLIGLLKVLRDDLPADPGGPAAGIGYTVLAWSRDGEHWERDRKPFMDRDPAPGSWDHAMTWGDHQLVVGNEMYIYYGGYARGHKIERFVERQIGLARMPRDRYVSRTAGNERGTLVTPAVTIDASSMTLNVDAHGGSAEIQVLDPDTKRAIDGFSFAQCGRITTDSLAAPVRWKKPLSKLAGRRIRLEFALRNANLYCFDLKR